MRKLTATICLTLALLLGSAGERWGLPPCPEESEERYHNCYGAFSISIHEYVGEWRDNKKHASGTETLNVGDSHARTYVGEWSDGKTHGYGTEYDADRTVTKQGYWKNYELIRSTKEDKNEKPRYASKPPASSSDETISAASAEQNKVVTVVPPFEFGDYHALVISNNDYAHLPKLKNALQDARDVSTVLRSMCGFKVQTLENATRSEILNALVKLRAKLTWGNTLLIYYAGHGILDGDTEVGYWQPIEAEEEDFTNWIPNSTITTMLKAMSAKHAMVIADFCYSGTLVRSTAKGLRTAKDHDAWLKRVSQMRSRTALVSGGIEPVMDGGGGKNSIFAKALLTVLRDNQSVIDGTALFEALKRRVVLGSEQTPRYADIRQAEHDGGDFLLVRRDVPTEKPGVTEGADPLEKIENKCAALGFTKGTEKHGDCVMKLYK